MGIPRNSGEVIMGIKVSLRSERHVKKEEEI
jgi:hypothetical protein